MAVENKSPSKLKRMCYRLQGEINCLKNLIETYDVDGTVSVTLLRVHLKEAEEEFNVIAAQSRRVKGSEVKHG